MNRLMLIMTLLTVLMGSLIAQETEAFIADNAPDTSIAAQGFGVHFGNVSGNGYAWRYLKEKWGVQLVVGGLTSGKNDYSFDEGYYNYDTNPASSVFQKDNGRKYYFNLGANGILPLSRTSSMLFYLHGGINWQYTDQQVYNQEYIYDYSSGSTNYYDQSGDPTISHKIKSYANIGVGPGFEFFIGKNLKLALELPITYTGNNEFYMYIPQAGLYYYFK
jgi:hypothetical protein